MYFTTFRSFPLFCFGKTLKHSRHSCINACSPFLHKGLRPALVLIILIFSCSRPLCADPFSGRVEDIRGSALADVNILLLPDSSGTVTDDDGRFLLLQISPGDSLLFSHIAFRNFFLIYRGPETQKLIILQDTLLSLHSVTRHGQPLQQWTLTRQVGLPGRERAATANELASEIPGLFSRGFGSYLSPLSMSYDAGPSTHTQLRFAGMDLTDPQTGQADMTWVPVSAVSSYSLQTADLAEYGSGVSDAVVELQALSDRSSIQLNYGSFDYRALNLSHSFTAFRKSKSIPDAMISVHAAQQRSEGDFPYSWDGESLRRKNNDTALDQFYLDFRQNSQQPRHFGSQFLLSRYDAGTPGLLWNAPDTLGRRSGESMTGSLNWTERRVSTLFRTQLSAYANRSSFANPLIMADSEHSSSRITAEFTADHSLSDHSGYRAGLEYRSESLNSSDAGLRRRHLLSMRQGLHWSPSVWTLSGTLNLHSVQGRYSGSSFSTALRRSFRHRTPIYAEMQAAEYFRLPSFNELYWQPGGNPELKPERSRSFGIRLHIQTAESLVFQQELFIRHSFQMIQWLPQQQYWRPVNVQESLRTGLKFALAWHPDALPVSLNTHLSLIRSADLNSGIYQMKSLRFVPAWLFDADIQYSRNIFSARLELHAVGPYISMYGYPEDLVIAARFPLNGSLSYVKALKQWQSIFSLKIYNLSDLRFESVTGYPEMGRSLHAGIELRRQTDD